MTTTVPTHGGPAMPVSADTSGRTIGRVAMRVYGFTSEAEALAAGFVAEAGPAASVYIVSDAEIASGKFVAEGDPKAVTVYTAPAGMRVEGGYSTPIYPVNTWPNEIFDLYVDGASGNDTTGTGTLAKPYKTITKGVAMASSGKKVGVKGGTYREGARVDVKAGVTIKRWGSTPVIVSRSVVRAGFTLTAGQASTYEMSPGAAVHVTWQDTSTSLVVKTSIATVEGTAGTFWYDSGSGKLYVHCTDNADPATHLIETNTQGSVDFCMETLAGSTIDGLTLRHGNAGGLWVAAASTVKNCIIEYQRGFNGYGMKVDANLTTSATTIRYSLYNVYLSDGIAWTSNNDDVSYAYTGAWGNDGSPSFTVTFGNLHSHHNTGAGLEVYTGMTVTGGEFNNNSSYGLQIINNGVTVTGAYIHENSGRGILSTANTVTVSGCTFYNNTSSEITISGTGAKVTGCTITTNTTGVGVGAGGTVEHCTITTTATNQRSIECANITGLTIHANTIVSAATSVNAININTVVNADVNNNIVTGGQVGIYLQACTAPSVTYNTAYGCGAYGIELESCTAVTVSNNTTYGNANIGIVGKDISGVGSTYANNVVHDEAIGYLSKGNTAAVSWTGNRATTITQMAFYANANGGNNNTDITIDSFVVTGAAKVYVIDAGQSTNMVSDNNTFTSCTQIGTWSNGTTYATLAAWKTATGLDTNSTAS